MFLVFIISLFYLILATYININWINEIAAYFGYPFAIYLVVFVALIPGFIYIFTLISILIIKRKKQNNIKSNCNITILIPVYNAMKSIEKTIESILCQKYCGKINIIVIDDGSTDESLEILKKINQNSLITLLEIQHKGKAYALNEGLKHVKTEYVITVDSDTILHPLAIQCIMDKIVNSKKDVVATAGSIFVQNDKENFVTKLQQWDYTLGIFGVKLYQGNYDSTLVTQDAFRLTKQAH